MTPEEIEQAQLDSLNGIKSVLEDTLAIMKKEQEVRIAKDNELALQKEEEAKNAESNQATQEELDQANATMQQNIATTATNTLTANETMTVISQKIDSVLDSQLQQKTVSVESGWLIVLAVVLSIGMKIFYENTLKW